MDAPVYSAFISYSHRDEPSARWLQRALERYRVPGRLVGRAGAHGPIPNKLRPVFRDREDLSSAADLSEQIRHELDRSDCLVVICSPAAAGSRWVNEEIRYFRDSGRGNRILALIVDGDPRAADCFPRALLDAPDGARHEPLAADLRQSSDGKRLASLKIVAGILGIRLDELVRRDAQRRRRLLAGSLTAAASIAAVIAWLGWSGMMERAAGQARQANAQELLRFMLGDLDRLDPIPGVEVISPSDDEQLQRRVRLGLEVQGQEELMQSALAWREQGQDLNWRGRLPEALEKFLDSRAAIVELYVRDGQTPERMLELAQAEFYLGDYYLKQGELDEAQQHCSQYGALARRLMNLDPTNPAYVMELSYGLQNLVAVEQARPQPDIAWVVDIAQAALEYNQMALLLDPGNATYRQDLDNTLAWLADALRGQCALGRALEVRQKSLEIFAEDPRTEPGSMQRQKVLALRLSGLAAVQKDLGLDPEAQSNFRDAVQALRIVFEADPQNTDIEWEMLYREERLARLLLDRGEYEAAGALIDRLAPRMVELERAGSLDANQQVQALWFEMDRARLSFTSGATDDGRRTLDAALERMIELAGRNTGMADSLSGLVMASFLHWEQFGAMPEVDLPALLGGFLADPGTIQDCSDADLAVRKALMEGDLGTARSLAGRILGQGYRDAAFLALCQRYPVCGDF